MTVAGTVLASAQVASRQTESASTSTSPVAYVYVSTGSKEINAFAAASNAALTRVSGSPFFANVGYMALNGKYLFATNGTYIYSYSIASNGALKYISAFNATQRNPYGSGGPGDLFLDHSGQSLYDGDTYAYGTGSNAYQFFSMNNYTGHFYYSGITPDGGPDVGTVLSFIGNNLYGYSSGCYHFTPDIYGYKRNSDGSLTPLNINPSMPTGPSGDGYCPYLAAADPTNHVAVSMTLYNEYTQEGQPQLAVYTADGSGNLTTGSTMSNMPKTLVTQVLNMAMAPSGKLLAVSGSSGLQAFHFNGASPITHYTGLLTSNEVDQMFWDNANHLYAISRKAGKLYVFTVTPTSVSQAPGSPHTIGSPENIIVLPKS
jgi:hypothetical protein